jgi:hypothetical protein
MSRTVGLVIKKEKKAAPKEVEVVEKVEVGEKTQKPTK